MDNQITWPTQKRLKARAKLFLAGEPVAQTLGRIEEHLQPKILLVGTPIHDNLGDHLLALAEEEQLRAAFPDRPLIEIPTELYMLQRERIAAALGDGDVVCVTGGGWMGDVWEGDDAILRDIVRVCSAKCRVIVLPQTMCFSDPDGDYAKWCRTFWRSQGNFTLCLRESTSYQLALDEFGMGSDRCRLLPDMGLLYGGAPFPEEKRGQKVLLCLREDRESMLSSQEREGLRLFFAERGYGVEHVTTLASKVVSAGKRKAIVHGRIGEFGRGSLVVTDRLHGMVFSFLAQTPCVALDNKTKKVEGVYSEWLRGIPSISLAHGYDELMELAAAHLSGSSRQAGEWPVRAEFQEPWITMTQSFLKEFE